MKLLLDENLSRRRVPFLQHDFPESTQVILVGLESSNDTQIWEYANTHAFVIASHEFVSPKVGGVGAECQIALAGRAAADS